MASWEAIYWALPEGMARRTRERLASLAWNLFPTAAAAPLLAVWCLTDADVYQPAAGLLRELHALGVELTVRGAGPESQELFVRDQDKALTPNLRGRIDGCREEMTALLLFGPVSELTPGEIRRLRSAGLEGAEG